MPRCEPDLELFPGSLADAQAVRAACASVDTPYQLALKVEHGGGRTDPAGDAADQHRVSGPATSTATGAGSSWWWYPAALAVGNRCPEALDEPTEWG